jgi:hypothetical protein
VSRNPASAGLFFFGANVHRVAAGIAICYAMAEQGVPPGKEAPFKLGEP